MFLSRLNCLVDAPGASKRKQRNDKPAALCCRERISDKLAELILLLFCSGEEKTETVEAMNGFAFSFWFDGALAGAHRLDRCDQSWQHIGLRDGNIVRAE